MSLATLTPTAVNDTFATTEDLAIQGNVLLNDLSGSTVSTDQLSLKVTAINGIANNVGQTFELPSGALLTLYSDGTFSYNPLNPNHWKDGINYGGFNYLTVKPRNKIERAKDTFTYTVVNDQGNTSTATVTIDITGVNDAPILNDQTITVNENTAQGTVIGSIIPIHADLNDIVLSSIISGDSGFSLRNIKDARGFFRYAEVVLARDLNYEQRSSYQFTVSGKDYLGASDTAVITIKLKDFNEAPVLNDQVLEVGENSSIVGTVIATDVDQRQSLTYEIVGGNEQGMFTINGATGTITVKDGFTLNYESISEYQLTVKVTDNGQRILNSRTNLSDTGVVKISVLDGNDAPLLQDYTFQIGENSPSNTVVGQIAATDEDAGQQLSYNIVRGNDQGIFALDSVTGVISVATGAYLDYETTTQHVLEVSVSDNGNPSLSQLAQVTINVDDVAVEFNLGSGSFVDFQDFWRTVFNGESLTTNTSENRFSLN